MACRPSLLSSGDATIAWIAHNIRYTWLSPIVTFISDLGSLPAIILIMGLAYWCWNKHFSRTILYGIFLSTLLNAWLKGIVMECRPPKQFHLETISDLSYSFPSGHAQVTSLMWCGLAYYVRSKWLSIFYVVIALLIAFARPYMGVHYVHDVVVGFSLGLVLLGLCILNDKEHLLRLYSLPLWAQTLIMLIFSLVCHTVINNETSLLSIAIAGLFGTWFGSQLESRYIKFTPSSSPLKVFQCALVGFSGAALIVKGGHIMGNYLQYTLLGLWLTYFTPLLVYRWKPLK